MTGENLIINKKKSELNAKNKFDYEKLVYHSQNLLPCYYEEKEEEVIFYYDCNEYLCSNNIKKEDKENQFRFLVNFLKLYDVYVEYKIKFCPDNIFYDENYIPYVKERDLYEKGEKAGEEEFLFLYKTFVCAVLGWEYGVVQLQESGLEILSKEPQLKPYIEAKTKEELVDLLRREKNKYFENQKNNTVRISKRENKLKSIVSIAGSLLLILCVVAFCYLGFFLIPYQKSIINANEAYIQKDYVSCIDSMKEIDVKNMNINTKYILAFSYAKSESLEKEEIEILTSKLSINSNEKELEYWICLGRLDMERAESLAQSLLDDKLLIYAYLKELNHLQNNTSVEGEEKQARISELEENIKKLGDKYAPKEEEESSVPKSIMDEEQENGTKTQIPEAGTTELDTSETNTTEVNTTEKKASKEVSERKTTEGVQSTESIENRKD